MPGLTAPLSPIADASLADACYRILRGNILSLNLQPGSPLDEVQVATQLGVSKTPVREAIARLAAEGLIVTGSNRRSYVARLSPDSIREVAVIRMILEAGALQELAPPLPTEVLARITDSQAQASASMRRDDVEEFVDANYDLHMLLIEQTGNATLIAIMRGLLDHAARVTAAIFRSGDHTELIARAMESHARILAALAAGEVDRAAALLREDIRIVLDAAMKPAMRTKIEALNYAG